MDNGTVNIVHGNIAHTTQSNGFFTTGGGGGFSGGSSSGRRRRKKRLKAQEQVRREQAIAARNQTIATQTHQYESTRNTLEQEHESRRRVIGQHIQAELEAVLPSTNLTSSIPGDYSIRRDQDIVNRLLARKTAELQAQTARANAFFGSDPLNKSTQDYLNKLHALGSTANAHQLWTSSYEAAQSAKTLTETIRLLTDQSNALAARKIEHQAEWRAREQHWEQLRLKGEQAGKELAERDAAQQADIKALRKTNEERRLQAITAANTVAAPAAVAAARPLLMTGAGLLGAEAAAVALEVAIGDAMAELARIALIRTGQLAGTFVTLMTYSPVLGDGELTSEQRNRALKGLSVPADFLDLPENLDLRKIANEGGTVDLGYRIRSESKAGNTTVYLAKTNENTVPSAVKVVAGVLDPLTNTIHITGEGFSPITLRLTADSQSATTNAPSAGYSGPILAVGQPPVETIPPGADTRFNDRLVVFPQHLGLAPIYVSFNTPWGYPEVATGSGQPTTNDLRNLTEQNKTAAIPSQLADQLRGRESSSAFELKERFWKEAAKDKSLSGSLHELNANRMKNGYAPFAKKSDWIDKSRTLDLRYPDQAAPARDTYNFDGMGVVGPQGLAGTTDIASPATSWSLPGSPVSDAFKDARNAFSASAGGTVSNPPNWTPLNPPGSELLRPTPLPGTPVRVPVYVGGTTTPVTPQIETLPIVDDISIGTGILWLPVVEGSPQQYILLRDRRDDPGIANGFGQPISGTWLGEATRGAGAPIPAHIADQLRGKEFSSFKAFREKFWKIVAADPELSKQFKPSNRTLMTAGKAPKAQRMDWDSGGNTFELHHVHELQYGGEVFGIDNLRLLTPKAHNKIHKVKNHDSEKLNLRIHRVRIPRVHESDF